MKQLLVLIVQRPHNSAEVALHGGSGKKRKSRSRVELSMAQLVSERRPSKDVVDALHIGDLHASASSTLGNSGGTGLCEVEMLAMTRVVYRSAGERPLDRICCS